MAQRTTTSTSTKAAARKATTPTKHPARNAGAGNGNGKAKPAATPALTNKTGNARLGKGGLEAIVQGHFKANPKGEFSPSELANTLDRSGGAIANACEKLTGLGLLTRVSDAPRRYRHRATKTARTSTKR